MSVTVLTSGTQTTTTTASGYSLTSATAQGVYQLAVSCRNMTASATADWLEVQIFGRVLSTGTDELIDKYTILGGQQNDMFRSQPYISPHYFRPVIFHKQFALGSGTSFDWAIYSVS